MACRSLFLFNPASPCCERCPDYCFQEPSDTPDQDVWRVEISGITVRSTEPRTLSLSGCEIPWSTDCQEHDTSECAPCELANGSWDLPWIASIASVHERQVCPVYQYSASRSQGLGDANDIWLRLGQCLEQKGWVWVEDLGALRGGYWFNNPGPFGVHARLYDYSERNLWNNGVSVTLLHGWHDERHDYQRCELRIRFGETIPVIRETFSNFLHPPSFLYSLGSESNGGITYFWKWDGNQWVYDRRDSSGSGLTFECDVEDAVIQVTPP